MSAEEDARARRDAWVAAGAPDYNAPTRDSSGEINGYQSVAAQPVQQRSESNQGLAIVGGKVVDTQQPGGSLADTIKKILQQQIQPVTETATAEAPDPIAIDGQRLSGQPTSVQAIFRQTWGPAAGEHWVAEHNQAVLNSQLNVQQGGGQTVSGGGKGTGSTSTTSGGTGGSTGSGGTNTVKTLSEGVSGLGVFADLSAWVTANPLIAMAAAALLGSMLLGGSGTRRRY